MAIVVSRSLVRCLLSFPHGLQLFFAGVTAIGQASIEQGLDGFAVFRNALALDHRVFIPVNAQPLKAF